jgi:hypothetical protein
MGTYTVNRKPLRDLVWLLSSPSLLAQDPDPERGLSPWQGGQGLSDSDWRLLQAWEADPAPLLPFLQRKKNRLLGHYVESLLEAWFRFHPDYELWESGRQIREGKQSVGEIDFLFFCRRRQQPIHLEVAVKFYLCYDQQVAWDHWYGPNPRDRMSLKFPKMLDKQSQLLEHAAALPLREQHGLQHWQKAFLLKGRMYSHGLQGAFVFPQHLNPHHLQGRWLYKQEALQHLPSQARHWRPLPKRDYLASPQGEEGFLTSEELTAWLDGLQRAFQLLGRDPSGEQADLHLFVVPDDWPRLG